MGICFKFVLTVLLLFPFFEFIYHYYFRGFIDQGLISLMVREPSMLKDQIINVFGFWGGAGILILIIFSSLFFNLVNNESRFRQPFLLFKYKIYILLFLIVEVVNVRWAIRKDTSRILERFLLPICLFVLFSVIVSIFMNNKNKNNILRKVIFVVSPILFVFAYRLDYLGFLFPKNVDADLKLISSVFRSSVTKKLVKSSDGIAWDKRIKKIQDDFNILIILNDAQRLRDLSSKGDFKKIDSPIHDFLRKSYFFKYPVSTTNMTDTSIPTLFTGYGSGEGVGLIKNAPRIWDYFSNDYQKIYLSSADIKFSYLEMFLKSSSLNLLWDSHDDGYSGTEIVKYGDEYSFDKISQILKKRGEEKFFAVWHTDATHSYVKFPAPSEKYIVFKKSDYPSKLPKLINYWNSNFYIFNKINELLNIIDLEKTIIIITSDHGEGFGEHGYHFHNQSYHEEAVRVPFILYLPDRLKKRIGRAQLNCLEENQFNISSTLDLLPTLLDLHSSLHESQNKGAKRLTGESLMHCKDNRVVYSSHCIINYRCYKRSYLFASNEYSLIFDLDRGVEAIYHTMDDIDQRYSIPFNTLNKKSMKKFLHGVKNAHPQGVLFSSFLKRELKINGSD